MLKPKSKKDKEFFLVNYSIITGTKSSLDYFYIMIKLRGEDISKRMSDSITDEQIEKMIRNIYNNTDFNKYDKYKYWFDHYFLSVYLNNLKEEIIKGNIQASEYYSDFITKNIKITWFDKLKLRLTSDIFFEYLKDKYYNLKSDKIMSREYYKDRLAFYGFAEKILFFNKYRAFAVMQDFYYNAKRTAKYHFKIRKRNSTPNSSGLIVIEMIVIHFIAVLAARMLAELYVR